MPVQQDHSAATLAPILTRDDGRMDFSRSASEVVNRWRGFQPWPGAFTALRGKKLIVHRMRQADSAADTPAGELRIEAGRLFAGCAHNAIELLEVQLEGKKRMPAGEFLHGFQLRSGERLG
jgi:methionyl-tRNA formyltransferase